MATLSAGSLCRLQRAIVSPPCHHLYPRFRRISSDCCTRARRTSGTCPAPPSPARGVPGNPRGKTCSSRNGNAGNGRKLRCPCTRESTLSGHLSRLCKGPDTRWPASNGCLPLDMRCEKRDKKKG